MLAQIELSIFKVSPFQNVKTVNIQFFKVSEFQQFKKNKFVNFKNVGGAISQFLKCQILRIERVLFWKMTISTFENVFLANGDICWSNITKIDNLFEWIP